MMNALDDIMGRLQACVGCGCKLAPTQSTYCPSCAALVLTGQASQIPNAKKKKAEAEISMLHCAECKIPLMTIECSSYEGTLYCRPCYEQKKAAVPVYLSKILRCAHCGIMLGQTGTDCWHYDSKLYCQACYVQQHQPTAAPSEIFSDKQDGPYPAAYPLVRCVYCGNQIDEDALHAGYPAAHECPEARAAAVKRLTYIAEQPFAGGASSSRKPRYTLIPHDAILRLIAVMEKGIERKGDRAWNALSNNQACLLDEQFIISRIEHVINHAYSLLRRIRSKDWVGLDTHDDPAAIMWSGMFFCEVTRAMQAKEKADAEAVHAKT